MQKRNGDRADAFYFKRKSMDPLVEFVWLLLGSMVMWHIQQKYLGGGSRTSSRNTPTANPSNIAPPPQFSFNSSGDS